jgi:uncharacterized membrane protein YfcA
MPVYVATQHRELSALWSPIIIATIGVILGTLVGARVLRRIPEVWFHRVLAVVLAILGVTMVMRGLGFTS